MGQFESTICDHGSNDELVNALIKKEYIHSINVEKVLRSVDRGLYFTNDNNVNPYRDTEWQSGDVHLCSPRDYATVLESLDLHKGHKFLNIGSGIGYLSTLAGLLLGVNGVNHGIEIHSSLIDIAYQKLEVFKQNSAAIDYFEFCEPVFIKGNACELMSEGYYDRVYCGAEVKTPEYSFMKALIKIGGVLVMPCGGYIFKIKRIDEDTWETIRNIEVSIPDLVVAKKCSSMKVLKFPTVEPLSLQELCRSNIRASIRNCLNESQPGLQMRTKCKPKISYEKKLMDDTLNGLIQLHSFLNEVSIWEKETLGPIGNEVIEEDNNGDDVDMEEDNDDDNNGDDVDIEEDNDDNNYGDDVDIEEDNDDDNNGVDVDVEEKDTSDQCDKSLLKKTASDTKKKGSEAECSEQNKTLPEKPENTKGLRINTLSSTVENLSNSTSNSWETVSFDSSESDDEENDHISEDGIHNDSVDEAMSDYEYTEEVIARELIKFRFLSNRKENELSKLLKVKINLLPIPAKLKVFLNYNSDD